MQAGLAVLGALKSGDDVIEVFCDAMRCDATGGLVRVGLEV